MDERASTRVSENGKFPATNFKSSPPPISPPASTAAQACEQALKAVAPCQLRRRLAAANMFTTASSATSAAPSSTVSSAIERTNASLQAGSANGHATTTGVAHTRIPAYRPQLQDPSLLPGGRHPLSGISLRAFCLGIAQGFSLLATITLAYSGSPLWRTPFFLTSLATFHFLEFWTHAAYNTPLATTSAFLLDANGNAYKAAHLSAFVETTLMHSVFQYPDVLPEWIQHVWLALGLVVLAVGQTTRSMAIIHCGRNFNHTIQTYRRVEHELVTHGVYSIMRHPSYFGFFWWAIGTQIVLGNWFCLAAYVAVLWRFFSHRIRKEEQLLVEFFGKEYEDYRRQTGVMIPGIR